MVGISYLLLLRNSMPPPMTSCSMFFPFIWALTIWFPTFPLQASSFLSQLRQIQFFLAMQASSSGDYTLIILQRQLILFQMYLIHFFMPYSSIFPFMICQSLKSFSYRSSIFYFSSSFLRFIFSIFLIALLKSPFCCFSFYMISFLKFVFSQRSDSYLIWLRSFDSYLQCVFCLLGAGDHSSSSIFCGVLKAVEQFLARLLPSWPRLFSILLNYQTFLSSYVTRLMLNGSPDEAWGCCDWCLYNWSFNFHMSSDIFLEVLAWSFNVSVILTIWDMLMSLIMPQIRQNSLSVLLLCSFIIWISLLSSYAKALCRFSSLVFWLVPYFPSFPLSSLASLSIFRSAWSNLDILSSCY